MPIQRELSLKFSIRAEFAAKAAHPPVPPARRGVAKTNGAAKGVTLHLDDRFAAADGEDASFQRY